MTGQQTTFMHVFGMAVILNKISLFDGGLATTMIVRRLCIRVYALLHPNPVQ